MDQTSMEEVKLNARFPDLLKRRMDKYVAERKVENRKYSLNDLIVEGVRLKLDGPPVGVVDWADAPEEIRESIQADVDFRMAGLRTAAELSVPTYWEEWVRESKRLDGEAKDESFKTALAERVAAGLKLPEDWGKKSQQFKMAWLLANDRG